MTTPLPSAADCLAALEATWPAARLWRQGPFALRDGAGGGSRVSAATAEAAPADSDIGRAETTMRHSGQTPLFRLRPDARAWDRDFDARLAGRGYVLRDDTMIYAAEVQSLRQNGPAGLKFFPIWPPLAIQRSIWAETGTDAARLAIMARAAGARTALLARMSDRAAGTAFVACHGAIAMLHAMTVIEPLRRKGTARNLMHGAADWAAAQGASFLTLAVTRENTPARALYESLGMVPVTGYHYRIAPG